MNTNITARNVELDDALKMYIRKKIDKLERLYNRIYSCDVVLGEEKIRENVEIILHLKSTKIVAKETSSDLYASFDMAFERVKKQLRRFHDKVRSKRKKSVLRRIMVPLTGMPKGGFYEGKGNIVKANAFADKPMLPEEAKIELAMMTSNFLMYKNADTGEMNVIYKKEDGNYGLIEPKF